MIRSVAKFRFTILSATTMILTGYAADACAQHADLVHEPYNLETGLISWSISFENPKFTWMETPNSRRFAAREAKITWGWHGASNRRRSSTTDAVLT